MKYEGTLLVVRDMEVSRRFYREVLSATILMDLGEFVVYEGGFCLLTEKYWRDFMQDPDLKPHYGHKASQLGFEDEDIDAFMKHLNGFPDVRIACPLREYLWGQRSIRFYDPDLHLIEVGEDMKVVVKRFLKSGLTVDQAVERTMYPREFVEMCKGELDA